MAPSLLPPFDGATLPLHADTSAALACAAPQYFKLYLVNTGAPMLWRWGAVHHWERGDPEAPDEMRDKGFRLQKRVEEREVGLTMEDVLSGKSVRVRKITTWWKLLPHTSESWQHFSKVAHSQTICALLRKLHMNHHDNIAIDKHWTRHCEAFAQVCADSGLSYVADLQAGDWNADDLAHLVRRPSHHVSSAITCTRAKLIPKHIVQVRRSRHRCHWADHAIAAIGLLTPSLPLGCSRHHIVQAMAVEIVESEGLWVDVTDAVVARRRHHFRPATFDSELSASLLIDLRYRQTFVWVGASFCPWLPALACVGQITQFLSLKHAMLGGAYKRPEEPWSADHTFKVFMVMALVTLVMTSLPTIVWLSATPGCGPHCPPSVCEADALGAADLADADDDELFVRYKVYECWSSFITDIGSKKSGDLDFHAHMLSAMQARPPPPASIGWRAEGPGAKD
jgi:hypothetical protein